MGILFHYISMACTEKYTQYLPLFRFLNEYFLKQFKMRKSEKWYLKKENSLDKKNVQIIFCVWISKHIGYWTLPQSK